MYGVDWPTGRATDTGLPLGSLFQFTDLDKCAKVHPLNQGVNEQRTVSAWLHLE